MRKREGGGVDLGVRGEGPLMLNLRHFGSEVIVVRVKNLLRAFTGLQ